MRCGKEIVACLRGLISGIAAQVHRGRSRGLGGDYFIEYVLNLFRHGLWRILFGLGFHFFGTQYFAFESSARILA